MSDDQLVIALDSTAVQVALWPAPASSRTSSPNRRPAASGFDSRRPAVVASAEVSMHLTRQAIAATLRQVAALAATT